MKRTLSVAYLTADFLGASSLSINYYIALLLQDIEQFFQVARLTIFSHKVDNRSDCSLADVMAGHGIPNYSCMTQVFSVNCSDFDPRQLCSYDLIVCTYYVWGDVIELIKMFGREYPKIVYWLPSILYQEFLARRQMKWYRYDLCVEQQKKLITHADHIIFISYDDLHYGRKHFGHLVKDSSVIYPVPAPPPGDLVASTQERGEGILFGYAGRWDYRKGIQLLVEVFFRYFTQEGMASLHMLSDHSTQNIDMEHIFDPFLKKIFYSLQQCGAIQLFDWQSSRRAYLRFLKSCDVVIVPSLYDPFNIIAYDCTSLGTPIVLSRFCGVEELFPTDSDDLIKINPLDQEEFYAAIGLLAERVKAGRVLGNSFQQPLPYTWQDMVRQTFELYLRLCQN